jgi:phenylalanyl-tRNA synthetase beta chain
LFVRVSLKWLKEFVPVEATAGELADRLTMAGVAVDTVLYPGALIRRVVSGRLLAVDRHPDADRLFVCRVGTGGEELTIVTGAANVAAGQVVPVALHGSVLADGKTIKQSRLRGMLSQGMLCSGRELGLETRLLAPEEQHGIFILPPETPVGVSIVELMGLDDAILVLDLTPNRGDCLSVFGVAREVAALYGLPLTPPSVDLPAAEEESGLTVTIEDPALCRRYVARPLAGIRIAPSPLAMAQRLRLSGVRAINNVVDVTNYVMLELGQPLHAFDANRLTGGAIGVRRAREGEEITSLDGVRRSLTPAMLVIADAAGAVAVAGVMGGLDSEIDASTRDLVLESAVFDAVSVRRTSRALGLRSEASQRFEKGVDPAGCLFAADRAARLLLSLAGGTLLPARDNYPAPAKSRTIPMRPDRVAELLGVTMPDGKLQGILTGLGATVHADPASPHWLVGAPTYRPDLAAECDLAEEAGRVYGYMNLPETMPEGPTAQGGLSREEKARRLLARSLAGWGLREAVTMSMVDGEFLSAFGGAPDAVLTLLNPLSGEQSVLRTTLLPGLVGVLVKNFNRQARDMAVFELGGIFLSRPGEKLPYEGGRLAVAAMGSSAPHWQGRRIPYDFYYLKGLALAVFRTLGLPEPEMSPGAPAAFHPGRSAAVLAGSRPAGALGELHPALSARFGLPPAVAAMELDLDILLGEDWSPQGGVRYRPQPRVPAVERDLAVVVNRARPAGAVLDVIRRRAGDLLESASLFDVYEGDRVAADERSLAFKLVFRAPDRTLTDPDVNAAVEAVLDGLTAELDARLRR